MPWVRLDESFRHHPKVVQAGPLGIALHICGLSYAAQYLTDGFVPRFAVSTLVDFRGIIFSGTDERDEITAEQVAEGLVNVGIWEHAENGGYWIHDYLDYNPSKAQVLQERATKQAAGRAGGIAAAQARATAERQQNGSRRSTESVAELKPVTVPVSVPVTDTRSPGTGPRATVSMKPPTDEQMILKARAVLADKMASAFEMTNARNVLEDLGVPI